MRSKKLWITIGFDFVIRGWKLIRLPEKKFVEKFSIASHKEKITAFQDVTPPFSNIMIISLFR